jgi:hypothetical protein
MTATPNLIERLRAPLPTVAVFGAPWGYTPVELDGGAISKLLLEAADEITRLQAGSGEGLEEAANGEIVALVRALMKEATGANCTFADDDVRLLARLATAYLNPAQSPPALSTRNDVLEEAARVAEATWAYDDNLQKSAGCSTTGQRIATAIRALKSTPAPPAEDDAGKQCYEALKGVVAVADRKTDEFDAARAALAAYEARR